MFFNHLKSVNITNFCSIEQLDLDVENQRLTHIIGINNDDELSPSNGTGKSTIKAAICWCLFGVTESGITADAILPRNNPKNCKVETIWTNGPDTLQIIRYRAHKEKKNLLELYISNKPSTGKDNDDTQDLINNYLGFNYDLFCLLLTTGMTSKKMKDFMYMTDKEKKEFMGFLLDLSFLNAAQETVKSRLKIANTTLISRNEECTIAGAKLEVAQENLKNYTRKVEEHAKQTEAAIKQKKVLIAGMEADIPKKREVLENIRDSVREIVIPPSPDMNAINAKRGQIKAYLAHNDAQQTQKGNASKDILILTKKLGQGVIVDENIPCLVKLRSELSTNHRELVIKESFTTDGYTDKNIESTQKAISSEDYKYKTAVARAKEYADAKYAITCPTCGQPLSENHIHKIESDKELKIAEQETLFNAAKIVFDKKTEELEVYRINKIKKLEELNRLKIEELRSEIRRLDVLYEETKKQELARLSKERNIDAIQAQISNLNAGIITVDSIIFVNSKNINKLEAEVSLEETDIQQIQAKILELTNQKSTMKAQFTALKVEYDSFKKRIEVEEQEILKLGKEQENNPYKQFVDSVQTELFSLNEQIDAINKTISNLNEDIRYLEFWYDGFGDKGIKSYVLDSIVELLEQRANFALTNITNGNTTIGFCTQKKNKSSDIIRDDFTVEIFVAEQPVQFVSLSKGERCRVSFAVNYALKILGVHYHGLHLNFEWYDEVLDGLDEVGCYQVIQFLRHELKNYESIFVVSHNPNVNSLFDKNLIIEKTNGISRLRNE